MNKAFHVLLINPPDINEIRFTYPEYLINERGITPPLGILYVASNLRRHTDHRVSVIDCHIEGMDYPALKRELLSLAPDVVGITALSMALLDVVETVRLVKETMPKAKGVVGGPPW